MLGVLVEILIVIGKRRAKVDGRFSQLGQRRNSSNEMMKIWEESFDISGSNKGPWLRLACI